MKLRTVLFGLGLALSSIAFANTANLHQHAKANDSQSTLAMKKVSYPGYCQIEIINDSWSNLQVHGIFDDNSSLQPFNIYRFDSAHYISLFYYGYCHASMYLNISTFDGYTAFARYVSVDSTVRIYNSSWMSNKPALKVTVTSKAK